jgi:2-keto-4-pentenoate hydratase/2-oxohepta-3-ene-1,7-dioic acid hydratase in catechol pathway
MVRYLARDADGRALLGDDDGCVPLAAADPSLTTVRGALRHPPGELPDPDEASAGRVPEAHLQLASPLADPGKLLGIGLNYADHAADLDEDSPEEPASFFKPATAATGPGGPVRLPPETESERVTAEAELAVVIGRTCRDLDPGDVDDVVAGYVPVIDMTAEDVLQRNPRFLTRAKSYDTFLVVGPRLVVAEGELAADGQSRDGRSLADLSVRTVVNDEVVAENSVANMHFSPRELVAFHSRVMTLEPGDLISTGTPGAHPVEPGDVVRAEVDRVGEVTADVVR